MSGLEQLRAASGTRLTAVNTGSPPRTGNRHWRSAPSPWTTAGADLVLALRRTGLRAFPGLTLEHRPSLPMSTATDEPTPSASLPDSPFRPSRSANPTGRRSSPRRTGLRAFPGLPLEHRPSLLMSTATHEPTPSASLPDSLFRPSRSADPTGRRSSPRRTGLRAFPGLTLEHRPSLPMSTATDEPTPSASLPDSPFRP